MSFDYVTDAGRKLANERYLMEGETLESRCWDIFEKAGEHYDDSSFAERMYQYMLNNWITLASPVLANSGRERGLPVSCFGSYLGDSMNSILGALSEVGQMSANGGGCSGYLGELRPRGARIGNGQGESTGAVSFVEMFDSMMQVVKQGGVRRGHFSPYLDIEHPDFNEFVEIGSDEHAIQGTNHGIIISDGFMQAVASKDNEALTRMAKLIRQRNDAGFPYIVFRGNANRNKPEWYQDREINASNMCSEIMLPSNHDESFVCVLSSVNALYFDDWKDTTLVRDMIYFLDYINQEFIRKAQNKPFMGRAVEFARNHRALGLGIFGLHSWYQSNGLPFDSQGAAKDNLRLFKTINEQAWEASARLAQAFGEPKMMQGTGYRNTAVTAIAPTKSSSFIFGQHSQGIEPEMSNCYMRSVANTQVEVKNTELQKIIAGMGWDNPSVWRSIRENNGSVQHLTFLSQWQKDVFKTFGEIRQEALLEQAGVRQEYISQGQSLNLMIHPETPPKDVLKLYQYAHSLGIKSLYYQYNVSAAQEMIRSNVCEACEA